ncbi:competence type IV pilus minor pilin ComGD [Streptococcus catagoni]|nr:competence type IV pilus minor pilin ComGD [Streptococcus catagoni]
MLIIKNTHQKPLRSKIKAFSLLESLLSLFILTFTIGLLSPSVSAIYSKVEEKLFFIDFEHFYKNSQKLSVLKQKMDYLNFTEAYISYGSSKLKLPKTVKLTYRGKIRLNKLGGNHSLARIEFATRENRITYQLQLGSGTYKKTISKSLHSS